MRHDVCDVCAHQWRQWRRRRRRRELQLNCSDTVNHIVHIVIDS